MGKTFLIFCFCAAGIAVLGGCGSKIDPNQILPTGGGTEQVTYAGTAKEIFDLNCIFCHSTHKTGNYRNGAPPDVNLDTYEGIAAAISQANPRIQAGTMPPTGGIPLEDRALIQQWVDAGLPR